MLLDVSFGDHNVDSHNIYKHKQKKTGCIPQSASFGVIELDFLTYQLMVVKPWSFMQDLKMSMQI
jgi:hypothetical protein